MEPPIKTPFVAGPPVTKEHFYGRQKELFTLSERIEAAKRNALYDTYVILNGRRGYGKSSLLKELRTSSNTSEDILFINVDLSSKRNYSDFLKEIVNQVFSKLRRRYKKKENLWENILSKAKEASKYVTGLEIAGFKVAWNPKGESGEDVESDFIEAIPEIWEEIKSITELKALVITIDELDKLEHESNKDFLAEFAYGLKSIADQWRGDHKDILVIVSCLTSIYDELIDIQNSIDRGFETIEIGPFEEHDILDMFNKVFKYGSPQKSASSQYIEKIRHISGGIPYYIQKISDVAFREDTDNILDSDDFMKALPKIADGMTGRFGSAVRTMKSRHSTRVLRILASFEKPFIRLEELKKAVADSFEDENYIPHTGFKEDEEESYRGGQQVSNALTTLMKKGLIRRERRGLYKMMDPLTDFWVNFVLNEYSLEDSIKRSN